MYTHVHVYVSNCGDQKSTQGFFYCSYLLFFETGSLTMRKLTDLLDQLASESPGSADLYFLSRGLQSRRVMPGFSIYVGD